MLTDLIGSWGAAVLPWIVGLLGLAVAVLWGVPLLPRLLAPRGDLSAVHTQADRLWSVVQFLDKRGEPGDAEAAAAIRLQINHLYNPQAKK